MIYNEDNLLPEQDKDMFEKIDAFKKARPSRYEQVTVLRGGA